MQPHKHLCLRMTVTKKQRFGWTMCTAQASKSRLQRDYHKKRTRFFFQFVFNICFTFMIAFLRNFLKIAFVVLLL